MDSQALAKGLDLKMRKDASVYIRRDLWTALPQRGESATLKSVAAVPEYEVVVALGAGQPPSHTK